MSGYTYDMSVCLGKDRQNATQKKTVTHVRVKSISRRVEGVGHKFYTNILDIFFSPLDIFDDLHTRAINCCGTVRQKNKGIQGDFGNKTLKLKWSDVW
jgi:hypothetical protein